MEISVLALTNYLRADDQGRGDQRILGRPPATSATASKACLPRSLEGNGSMLDVSPQPPWAILSSRGRAKRPLEPGA